MVTPLELPIDHFRLLGVSPGMDAQSVLHGLQRRLDKIPDADFSQDTLDARAELLRASADLLSDEQRRGVYEAQLTTLANSGGTQVPALDLPPSKDVAGLLLLYEAGQSLECFQMACRCLQPPQAPVLRSSREADLTRLAALACLGAAGEFRHQRLFEASARTLQEGLHLLQRMGLVPDLREKMAQELDLLTPYRVLDLVSRDLGEKGSRQEGLELLEQLVRRRGGLEGRWDPNFSTEDFQPFFKQIRGFLTVQEQVDLFTRWGDEGSAAADFLATTALTASGFARRKPESIAAARNRLQASGRSGIEPLLANLHLLLGDVEAAKASFALGASDELKAWAASRSEDPLAQLCDYCRDWLSRDVLPGYRDLEANADLEAYFLDRDVMAYVENQDRFDFGTRKGAAQEISAEDDGLLSPPSLLRSAPPFATVEHNVQHSVAKSGEKDLGGDLRSWRLPHWSQFGPSWFPFSWIVLTTGAVAVLLVGIWFLRQRPPGPLSPEGGDPAATSPSKQASPSTAQPTTEPPGRSKQEDDITPSALPLQVESPTGPQIQALLEAWLAAKATVLRGDKGPESLHRLARHGLVTRLVAEQRQDLARGQVQRIDAKVKNLVIQERSPRRIAAKAQINYSDTRLDVSGQQIDRTPATTLTNLYVFGRDDGTWRLVAFTNLD